MNTKNSTFSIRFIAQKGKCNAEGKAPILARIIINGEKVHFSTKFRIDPDRWDSVQGRTLHFTKEEKNIDAMLDDYRALVISRYNEMMFTGAVVTASTLKMSVLNLDEKSCKLLELCDRFIEDYYKLVLSKSVTQCTYQRYVLTRNRLAEFMQVKYGVDDLPLADINHSFIKGFDLHNRNQHAAANNTAARFVKHFRTMYNLALHNGWARTDPFANYKIHFEKVNRGFLTQDEIDRITSREFTNKRLEVVRDMFLFSVYTGLAYIDVRELTRTNLQHRADGTTWIVTARQKTNNPVSVMLLDIPRAIMERYGGLGKKGRLLPIPSNQKVNDYLKEIATLCGIEKNLSYHLARHTFATTITLANGVPIETVSKILGHTSIKTTQIYARITDTKIGHDMGVLAAKLNAPPTPAPAAVAV
jgi:site-specific recombinase XerD